MVILYTFNINLRTFIVRIIDIEDIKVKPRDIEGKRKTDELARSMVFVLVIRNADEGTTSDLPFYCSSPIQYSEWLDGFTMLTGRDSISEQSGQYVASLTQIKTKMALFNLDNVEQIPSNVKIPALPGSMDFYYSKSS